MGSKHSLNEIAKAIETEAYNKGWNDALAAIKSAYGKVSKRYAEDQPGVTTAVRRPRAGSDADKVLSQIKKTPGLTGAELVAALKDAGTPVHERTVRTALHRLRGRFINQIEERWYVI